MKKPFILTIILGIASFCFAQTSTLDIAISGAKTYIETQLPEKCRVLIADLGAPAGELGVYAAQELSVRLVNAKHLTVVDRSADVMQSLSAETGYQLSGEVSDDSIQSIGRKTGAEAIITGAITGSADRYRLHLKITSVKTAELLGQYSAFFQTDAAFNALLASNSPPAGKPRWVYEPLTAKAKYEPGGKGVSSWYYDAGISNKTASEQLARTRARQNIQQAVAENIASDINSRIDITSNSLFRTSTIEDAETLIQSVITNSVRTRVPSYELLEWYFETGAIDGKEWHMAYVLVRFVRKDIIAMVEKIEPDKMADAIIKASGGKATEDDKTLLIQQLTEGRDNALAIIDEALGDR
ncbi:MAG: penicillin-binding protein activator LpoB [Treponema sp.]|nr:penicillin-binding protein activator LpoB [Treponema sp.]